MVKIAELTFCTFSGNLPIDTVSNTTLSGGFTGTAPTVINPLPGMVNRPGRTFAVNGTQKRYNYSSSSPLAFGNVFGSTQRRSFVLWYYCRGTGHDTDSFNNYIWNNGTTDWLALRYTGFRWGLNSVTVRVDAAGSDVGWHNAIMTVDRATTTTICYFDGVQTYSGNSVPSGTSATYIGHYSPTLECDIHLGYVATYDNILDANTVSGIYASGLRDNVTGADPLTTISGNVLDLNNDLVPNAPLYLINTSDGAIYEKTTATASGQYTIDLPLAGHYILATTAIPPAAGARAISLVISSSGTVTYYDGT